MPLFASMASRTCGTTCSGITKLKMKRSNEQTQDLQSMLRNGYTVEGLVPLKALDSLGFPPPDSGHPIKFGIFRAEFRHTDGSEWSESWMSWVDPGTEEPDFHVPESFGYLEMIR